MVVLTVPIAAGEVGVLDQHAKYLRNVEQVLHGASLGFVVVIVDVVAAVLRTSACGASVVRLVLRHLLHIVVPTTDIGILRRDYRTSNDLIRGDVERVGDLG